jgi:sulfatase maturation enzyme AslB (radical SAM superfamily)
MREEPPRFLFMDINQRCNLRCKHCHYWRKDDANRNRYLSASRRHELLQEFAVLSPEGTVVICGGESMLDIDDYFSITRECIRLRLRCFTVINGTMVRTEARADRMMTEGPSEITLSINSPKAETHDESRGVRGSYNQVVKAMRLLIDSRNRLKVKKPIYAMAVVFEQNYRDLDPFYDFILNDVGVDKLKLNFLQPSFGFPKWRLIDRFFKENVVSDYEALASVIQRCDRKYGLHMNPAWLEHVKMYHRSVRENRNAAVGWLHGTGTREHICNTYDRNIMVDLYGNAGLCFNSAFPSFPLGAEGDMTTFWYEWSLPIREKMTQCNRYCGISHSVRRENATLKDTKGSCPDAKPTHLPLQ